MNAFHSLQPTTGIASACVTLGINRAGLYRQRAQPRHTMPPKPRARSTLALCETERQDIIEILDCERFVDVAPATIYATLLDEGRYLGSVRTMYRVLKSAQQTGERRRQRRHPVYTKPELLAIRPNEVWSWDITKIKGPIKWSYFHLYVILDIFSRYVVGWMIAARETAVLAKQLIADTVEKQNIDPGTLTLHADRGSSMRDIDAVGKTRINIAGAYNDGRLRLYTACGILMHSSLAVTTEGLPLGLTAIKFWSRKKFKGANALKKKINPTRVPIEEKESIRWLENLRQSTNLLGDAARCVHIGDRESDIYELYCAAQDAGTRFLLRTCVDRLAGDGEHTIAAEMAEVDCRGLQRIEVRDRHGEVSQAVLELRFRRIRVLPPLYKQGRYPALELTVLHAIERGKPRGRDPIDWKLITNLPVTSRAEAIEKLQWYASRWKIEIFHKILKSGCQAERSKLRTAERLVNLLATFCILSW
jgi:hypothetical protein